MADHKPLYRWSLQDAIAHNEVQDWRDSYRENGVLYPFFARGCRPLVFEKIILTFLDLSVIIISRFIDVR